MNKDNLTHMQNALDGRRSDLAYNITQRAGAELVLHVLREDERRDMHLSHLLDALKRYI